MAVIRKTKSVKSVLHLFEVKNTAVSAVALVEELNQSMNKTTVYRILDRLENDGLVHSFTASDGLRWYAKCNGCSSEQHLDVHPHIQCKLCGKVECLDLDISIPKVKGYKIENVELFLIGKCSDCLI
jgi:Fur family ferric uptake transcriptional regulator